MRDPPARDPGEPRPPTCPPAAEPGVGHGAPRRGGEGGREGEREAPAAVADLRAEVGALDAQLDASRALQLGLAAAARSLTHPSLHGRHAAVGGTSGEELPGGQCSEDETSGGRGIKRAGLPGESCSADRTSGKGERRGRDFRERTVKGGATGKASPRLTSRRRGRLTAGRAEQGSDQTGGKNPGPSNPRMNNGRSHVPRARLLRPRAQLWPHPLRPLTNRRGHAPSQSRAECARSRRRSSAHRPAFPAHVCARSPKV